MLVRYMLTVQCTLMYRIRIGRLCSRASDTVALTLVRSAVQLAASSHCRHQQHSLSSLHDAWKTVLPLTHCQAYTRMVSHVH